MYIYIYLYMYIHILMDRDINIHMLPHLLKTSPIDRRPSNASKTFPNLEAYVLLIA